MAEDNKPKVEAPKAETPKTEVAPVETFKGVGEPEVALVEDLTGFDKISVQTTGDFDLIDPTTREDILHGKTYEVTKTSFIENMITQGKLKAA